MAYKYINYSEIDPDRLLATAPEVKTVPKSTLTYNVISLRYNYSDNEKPDLDNVYIQLPQVICPGIGEYTFEDGSTSKSILMTFPQDVPENALFRERWDSLFMKTAEVIFKNRLGGQAKSLDAFINGGQYPNPLSEPVDRVTNEVFIGRPPRMAARLIGNDNKNTRVRTRFTGLNGQEIPWADLYNVDATIFPLIKIRDIFIGATTKLRIDLDSAVVVLITPVITVPRQLDFIAKIAKENPDKVAALEESLNKMRLEKEKEKEVKPTSEPPATAQQKGKAKAPAQPNGSIESIKGKQPSAPKQTARPKVSSEVN